jgi:hypothetical protein
MDNSTLAFVGKYNFIRNSFFVFYVAKISI